jgi:Protein of unknown function (DUF1501)
MSQRNELDRRNFMKSLLVGTGAVLSTPFEIYLSNVMIHFLQKSYALAADDLAAFADKKFIHLSMVGGAPRWYWDQPLNPNGNDNMGAANQMLITRMTNNGGMATGGSYATTKIGNFYLPHMWSGNIPTPNGGSAPMANLAQNMLSIRGIDLQADGHDSNRYKQTMVASGSSLLGLVAEQGKTPIPATAYGSGAHYYASSKGVGQVESGSGSPLTDFLNPFLNGSSLQSVSNTTLEASIDRVLRSMASVSSSKHKFLPTTYEQRLNAKTLLKKDFGNLQASYNSLVNKYENLISRSFGDSAFHLAGVEDSFINSEMYNRNFTVGAGGEVWSVPGDLRGLTDSGTSIAALSASMAVAEYMVTQGFSSSVNVLSGDFVNVNTTGGQNIAASNAPAPNRKNISIDCHESGCFSNLLLQTRNYRAHSACLYELINSLKAVSTSQGSLFDQTAIAVTSEFSRAPRTDGSGSDHGFAGTNYVIYSGAIPELTVVGNVGDHSQGYGGKWAAAPVSELGGRTALIGNVASSFTTILDLKSPTPNDASFVYRKDNKVYPAFKGPKNV